MKRLALVVVRCALVAATCGFVSLCSATAIPDPVIWYDMEAVVNGKVPDKSGNGRDMTLGSGATLTNGCGGATGTALFFDGTRSAYSTFQCPALGSRTVAFWFRRELGAGSIGSANSFPYLIKDLSSLQINLANASNIAGSIPAHDYYATIFASSGDNASQVRFMYNSTVLGLWREVWAHVAITLDETSQEQATAEDGAVTTISHITFKAYVNGVLVSAPATDFAVTNLSRTGTAVVGNWNGSDGARAIFGAVDEFRVWDAVLDADQILAEYERTKDNFDQAHLLGRWTFDDTSENGSGNLVLLDTAGQAGDITCGSGIVVTNAGIEGNAVWCNGYKTCWGKMTLPFALDSDFTWTCWVNQSPDSWKDTTTKIGDGDGNGAPRLVNAENNWWFINMRGGREAQWDSCGLRVKAPGFGDESPDMDNCRAPQGAWSHLAVTERFTVGAGGQRRAAAKIYMNGELAGEIAERNVGTVVATTVWYLGNSGQGNDRPFEGFVDDLRLYKGVISTNTIRRLYRGAAAVNAGDDFTVADATAELHGEVGVSAPDGIRTGYAGTPQWSLVSAPAGGEGAAIVQPNSPVTQITLPVVGSYVFRLSNVLDDVGLSRSDDVTVTRAAAAGATPTVSAAVTAEEPYRLTATATSGARIRWTKVSGPGGVWFADENAAETSVDFGEAGTYVVRCTAEKDGAAAVSDVTVTVSTLQASDLSSGLIRWWPLNGADMLQDKATGAQRASMMTNSSGTVVAAFEDGLAGHAFRVNGFDAYFSLGNNAMNETRSDSSKGNSPPVDRYRAVSVWVYHDSADTNTFKNAAIFMNPFQLGLWYNCNCPDGTADGLLLCQQGWGLSNENIAYMKRPYALPHSFIDRWTHIYALFDRSQGTDFELWIDGVKQAPTSAVTGQRGRIFTDERSVFCVGGIKYVAADAGADNGYSKNSSTQEVMSRCFPGKVADVRIYNRKLTAREVKTLAANPDTKANYAPVVDAFEKNPAFASTYKPMTVTTAVFDDGEPSGSSMTYRWSVISGDASKVVFGDATARETTFTALKKGTYVVQLAVSDGERTTYSQPLTVEAQSGFVIVFK